jgi:hypothetical protein
VLLERVNGAKEATDHLAHLSRSEQIEMVSAAGDHLQASILEVRDDLPPVLDGCAGIEVSGENEHRNSAADRPPEVVAEIGIAPRFAERHERKIDGVAEQ